MSNPAQRIETLTKYLRTYAAPSQESVSEQVEHLLFLGNVLGLYDATDYFRQTEGIRKEQRQETPAERYTRIAALEATAARELEAHYLPPLRLALAEGRVDDARALFQEIPESVTQVFALDAFRQAGVSLQ